MRREDLSKGRSSRVTRQRCLIMQISQPYAQVMVQDVRHADGEAEAKQALSEAEDVEIVVAAEQPAGDRSPQKRCGSEGKIGKESGCE